MALSYVGALIVARRCCSLSIICDCRIQNVHARLCRRRTSGVLWTHLPSRSLHGPVVVPSAPSCRQTDRHVLGGAQQRGGSPSYCTSGPSSHDGKQENSNSETVPAYSEALEFSRNARPPHKDRWRNCASVEEENWAFFWGTEYSLRPLLFEPRTRSLSFVKDLCGATRQASNRSTALPTRSTETRHGLIGEVRIHDLSSASSSRGVAHLRPQGWAAEAMQREMPRLSDAPLYFGRGHSVDRSSLVPADRKIFLGNSVQRPCVPWRGLLSVVLTRINFHGTSRKPSLREITACICKHCTGAVPRELDILCKPHVWVGVIILERRVLASSGYTAAHTEECIFSTLPAIFEISMNCGRVLQPRYDSYEPGGFSFFDLLELKPDFALDPAILDAKHKKLQKELHPDRNLNADEEVRTWSEEHRKQIVLAVATLRCPARRVLHLLQHHFHSLPGGVEKEEVERVTDSDLLTEVLELNEALEGVRTREELDEFEKRIQNILQADEKALAATFRKKDVEGMRKGAQRYMMHAGLLERIKNWSLE